MPNWFVNVKNGFPGANVWVTIYYGGLGGRRITTSGNVPAEGTQTLNWSDSGFAMLGYYIRCETFINVEGTSHKLSDTTMELGNDFWRSMEGFDDRDGNWGWVTLLPGSGPSTYIEPGQQPTGTVDLGLSTGTLYLLQAGISESDGNNTPAGYLSADPNNYGQCVIESRSSFTDNASALMVWLKQDTPNGSLLTNQGTNTVLYVAGGNGARAQLIPNTPDNQLCSLWTIGGDFPNRVAVRPWSDDGQNLNVFGDGPYDPGNAVGTWGWGGGAPNEVWTFVPYP